jgi:hypothetical protein
MEDLNGLSIISNMQAEAMRRIAILETQFKYTQTQRSGPK